MPELAIFLISDFGILVFIENIYHSSEMFGMLGCLYEALECTFSSTIYHFFTSLTFL